MHKYSCLPSLPKCDLGRRPSSAETDHYCTEGPCRERRRHTKGEGHSWTGNKEDKESSPTPCLHGVAAGFPETTASGNLKTTICVPLMRSLFYLKHVLKGFRKFKVVPSLCRCRFDAARTQPFRAPWRGCEGLPNSWITSYNQLFPDELSQEELGEDRANCRGVAEAPRFYSR